MGQIASCSTPLPSIPPRAQYGIRIFVAAQAAVKSGQRADNIAFFDIVVMAQNSAAVAQIGADVEKVV